MGWLNGSKKTFVSSVVYNLAGDINTRPNFLKTVVTNHVINNTDKYVGESITNAYLGGPGIQLRRFSRWAENQGYNALIGMRNGVLNSNNSINLAVLEDYLPHEPDEGIIIQTAELGLADYLQWAMQFVMENYPLFIDTDWVADYNGDTNLITVEIPGSGSYSFTPDNFDLAGRYMYVTYFTTYITGDGSTEVGEVITLPEDEDFDPLGSEWSLVDDQTQINPVTLNTKVEVDVTYSDSTPPEHTETNTPVSSSYSDYLRTYERTSLDTLPSGEFQIHKYTLLRNQGGEVKTETTTDTIEEDLGDGVTKTTVTTTTKDYISYIRLYREDITTLETTNWNSPQMFIYKQGSGVPALDAMFATNNNFGLFFPVIPIRVWETFISEEYLPDVYEGAKKALKKATSGKYDDIVEKIEDNESIDDIDFAYVVFGASLNSKENSAKRYIYEFFKAIAETTSNPNAYADWKAAYALAHQSRLDYIEWMEHGRYKSNGDYDDTVRPPKILPYPAIEGNGYFNVSSKDREVINYDITILWDNIRQETVSGVHKPGAKKGDCSLEALPNDVYEYIIFDKDFPEVYTTRTTVMRQTAIYFQETNTSYKKLTMLNVRHDNYIYNDQSVDIWANSALADPEESGFIVPLHDGIYRQMSMKDATQMSTACCYLVFNCYEVVRSKWYQTGLFQVVIIIVIVIISAYSGGATAGLLGTNAAVGASLGFAAGTTLALIVGAAANAIAAMILAKVISEASLAIFGDKIGSIVGSIAAVIAVSYGTAYQSALAQNAGNAAGTSASVNLSSLVTPQNVIKLTLATVDGLSDYVKASVAGVVEDTMALLKEYEQESAQIQAMWEQTFGVGAGGQINTFALTDAIETVFTNEPPDSYLQRTLLTGSEIAEISQKVIDNFTDLTLTTELPI